MTAADRYVGKHLGRYLLVRLLDQGGMANVYLARLEGSHGFQKTLAVKVIHPDLARDRRLLAMFLDEARVASRINHTNVCSIVDFGVEEGVPYIVMEHLDGTPLSALLQRAWDDGGLYAPLAARIVADAARGLHGAHETRDDDGRLLKVVHRDVSPPNVFVLREGAVRVLDFGIARMRGRLAATGVGEIKGKAAYMAPEQLGDGAVDRRADVWALGVVLWEACLGRRLFLGADFGKSVDNVLSAPVPRPSKVVSGFPAQLEKVILSALERRPDARIATAAELADRLEAYLYRTGQPYGTAQVAALMERHFGESGGDAPGEDTTQTDAAPPGGVGFDGTESIDMSAPGDEGAASVGPRPSTPSSAPPPPDAEDATTERRVLPPRPPSPSRRRRGGWLPLGIAAALVAALIAAVLLRAGGTDDEEESVVLAGPGTEPPPDRPAVTEEVADSTAAEEEVEVEEEEVEVEEDVAAPQDFDLGTGDLGDQVIVEARLEQPRVVPSQGPSGPRTGRRRPVATRDDARRHSATPAERGSLNLLAIPAAVVSWRGRPLGRTPLVERPMPPGRHTLRLEPVGGGEARNITVVIRAGETTRQSVRLR